MSRPCFSVGDGSITTCHRWVNNHTTERGTDFPRRERTCESCRSFPYGSQSCPQQICLPHHLIRFGALHFGFAHRYRLGFYLIAWWFVSNCVTFFFSVTVSVGCLYDDSQCKPPFSCRIINASRMFRGYERLHLLKCFTSGRRDTWCIGSHVSIDGGFFHQRKR